MDPRKLLAQRCLLNRQIAAHTNNAQVIFVENGLEPLKEMNAYLLSGE